MRCLKCGNRISEGLVFCDACLTGMQDHPVPQGTPLHIHTRSPEPAKRQKKPEKSAEEQIRRLKKARRSLVITVVVLSLLLLCVTGYAIMPKGGTPSTGQNYTVDRSVQTP